MANVIWVNLVFIYNILIFELQQQQQQIRGRGRGRGAWEASIVPPHLGSPSNIHDTCTFISKSPCAMQKCKDNVCGIMALYLSQKMTIPRIGVKLCHIDTTVVILSD